MLDGQLEYRAQNRLYLVQRGFLPGRILPRDLIEQTPANDVAAFKIDSNSGALTFLQTMASRSEIMSIALSGGIEPVTYTPTFAFTANSTDNSISALAVDPITGVLTPIPGSPFSIAPANGPNSVAVDPGGRFAYFTNQSNNVSALGINSGVPTQLAGSPFPGGSGPSYATVDPSGRFLYVGNTGGNISVYAINFSTGALTQIRQSPFSSGLTPQYLTLDPSGRFLYVPNFPYLPAGTISAFEIDPTNGDPVEVNHSPFTADGGGPGPLVVEASGKFAYTVTEGTGSVSAYSIDRSSGGMSGTLTEIPGSPFILPAGLIFSLAVDPWGRYLYAYGGIDEIFTFAIDSNTGSLIWAGLVSVRPDFGVGGKIPVASEPFMQADPSGRFLYLVTTQGGNNPGYVDGWSIDPNTGALTPIPGLPFYVGVGSSAVYVTGTIQ